MGDKLDEGDGEISQDLAEKFAISTDNRFE